MIEMTEAGTVAARSVLAALATLCAAPAARADTFVLVHGAWVGEWAWDEVVPLLEAQGHAAVAVAMRGTGGRAAEGGPDVSVDNIAEDVAAAIEAAREPVILVAHSWGGRPATGAWDRAREDVKAVVYVEALTPLGDGLDAIPADGASLAFVVTMYPDAADAGMMDPPPMRAADVDPAHPLAPMSLKALYGPVTLSRGPLPPTPGTYVYADASSLPRLRQVGEAMRDRRGWDLRTVPGGHDVPNEQPGALAAVLLEIAARD